MALLVRVSEEGTDKDSISDLMVVDPIKLFHGGQISFLKEVYFYIRKELISQRKDISLFENMAALKSYGRCENALSRDANCDLSPNGLFIVARETAFAVVENPSIIILLAMSTK